MAWQWRNGAWVGLLVFASLGRAEDDLARKIEDVVAGPDYKQAHWGILVVDAKTGKTVYEKNPEQLFVPASTTKLYSCAAALGTFGPDYRFETPVYQRGAVKEGVLRGDLILVASGDLTFGGRNGKEAKLAFSNNDHTYANSGLTDAGLTDADPLFALEELAKQVVKSGIREVRGEILIDDRLFARSRGSGSGPDLLTPVIVNDNVLDLIVTPGQKPGDAAQVETRPKTGFYQMDAVVATGDPERATTIALQMVGPNQFTVRGEIPVGAKPVVRIYPVEDPSLFARTLFIEALRKEGVRVNAALLQPARFDLPPRDGYSELKQVALFRSNPFSEAIRVTLKVSHNLYASTLPLLIAAKNGQQTLEDGLRRQGRFLKKLGVPVETISFAGGAGGANADSVTPAATIKLLQAMSRQPEWEAYLDGLPILGVDGTLATTVAPDSPVRGKVRAKTGTLVWNDALNHRSLLRSKALAGTMETAKGTQLYVAMFVNNVPLPEGVTPAREGKVLGKLCELIYRYGP